MDELLRVGAATFHTVTLTKHVLAAPQRKLFDAWYAAINARLHDVARKPDEPFRKHDDFSSPEEADAFIARHRGPALPPAVLDPSIPYDANPDSAARGELVQQFVAGLRASSNRFVVPFT